MARTAAAGATDADGGRGSNAKAECVDIGQNGYARKREREKREILRYAVVANACSDADAARPVCTAEGTWAEVDPRMRICKHPLFPPVTLHGKCLFDEEKERG